MVWQVFTARKSFSDPVIGSRWANRCGLHLARIRLSDVFLAARRWWLFRGKLTEEMQQFRRDGFVALEGFLEPQDYKVLKANAEAVMQAADATGPAPSYRDAGFGKPHIYNWGFDRCDGSTVNRFYTLPSDDVLSRLADNPRFRQLLEYASGCRFEPRRLLLYRLIQGSDGGRPDNQRDIHRDTFHSCVKFWFALSDVSEECGPLHYLKGSQRFNEQRWRWEKARSIWASENNKGGAFRCSAAEAKAQYGDVPQPLVVKENTLVLADVRGWHHRGYAKPGTERLAVYGSFRPSPFGLPKVRPLDSNGQ